LIADSRRLLATACTLLEDARATARRLVSPNGARFDSPGRQPWVTHSTETQAPKRRDSRKGRRATTRNRAPLGLHVELRRAYPGLTRPGLSNPAPVGAERLAAEMKCEPTLPAGILAYAFSRWLRPGAAEDSADSFTDEAIELLPHVPCGTPDREESSSRHPEAKSDYRERRKRVVEEVREAPVKPGG